MTNEQIKLLKLRIETGNLLDQEEQLELLQQLFRANRRVMAAKKAGFNTDPFAGKDDGF